MATRILIVEDEPNIGDLERRRLEKAGFAVSVVLTGREAIERLRGDDLPDLLLIDVRLPDMSGIEVLREANRLGVRVPSVIVTGAGDEKIAVSAMKLGALDYVVKDAQSIKALPETCSEALGKFRLSEENVRLVEELKRVNIELVEANRRLGEISRADELTGVLNRRTFFERLSNECSTAERYEFPLSLCLLDIDRFKEINDTHGHPVGDVVLRQFAFMLKARLRGTDFIGRLGGEEFAVVLPCTPLGRALRVCDELRRLVAEAEFGEEGSSIRVTTSAGVAALAKGLDSEGLVRIADKGLYRAKNEGRNRVATVQEAV
ncbi:MAG: diguanylate cyclase [Nitrospirota bacterium]|jgi:two-component system cell cycle response regulator